MHNILLNRYLTSMQMMMYWTSGWYVLKSNDGISKKRNQSLIGFAYPVRPVHSEDTFLSENTSHDLNHGSAPEPDEIGHLQESIDTQATLSITNSSNSYYDYKAIDDIAHVKGDNLVDAVSDPYNYMAIRLGKTKEGYRIKSTNNEIPSRINITVGFGYDNSVKEKVGSKSLTRTWLEEVFIHMTTYFQHPSLQTKIDLQLHDDTIFIDDDLSLSYETCKKSLRKAEDNRSNKSGIQAYLFFTNLPGGTIAGVSGHTNVGSICTPKNVGVLRGPDRGILDTAGTAAHELGHILGILHDFEEKTKKCRKTKKENCCTGFMDYAEHPNSWSDCSVQDLQFSWNRNTWNC